MMTSANPFTLVCSQCRQCRVHADLEDGICARCRVDMPSVSRQLVDILTVENLPKAIAYATKVGIIRSDEPWIRDFIEIPSAKGKEEDQPVAKKRTVKI